MFGFPAYYTRGRLFACAYGEGVGVKLPEAMVRALDGAPGFRPFQPYGKCRMKQWLHVRNDRLKSPAEARRLLDASISFVAGTALTRASRGRR